MTDSTTDSAKIYHYGWVKPPDTMTLKRINFHKLYHAEEEMLNISESSFKFDDFGNLKRFEGSHPEVMKARVEMSNWNFDAKLDQQHPDWIRKILIFLFPLTKRIKKVLNLKS